MARKNLRIKKKKKKRRHGKQKFCYFTKTGMVAIDYKDEEFLRRFVTERGKIARPRRTAAGLGEFPGSGRRLLSPREGFSWLDGRSGRTGRRTSLSSYAS